MKKQTAVSRPSAEAELRAMAVLTVKVTWLRWLLEDFGVSVATPTTLLSDSTYAISIARDAVKHELTKHIGVDASFVRASVQDQIIALQYVPSELISLRRPRLEHNMVFSSLNSVLRIHYEFEGNVKAILHIVHFPRLYEGSLAYSLHLYMYILWPLAP
jgi:hypothetical protein